MFKSYLYKKKLCFARSEAKKNEKVKPKTDNNEQVNEGDDSDGEGDDGLTNLESGAYADEESEEDEDEEDEDEVPNNDSEGSSLLEGVVPSDLLLELDVADLDMILEFQAGDSLCEDSSDDSDSSDEKTGKQHGESPSKPQKNPKV
jgi:hypothetical protein